MNTKKETQKNIAKYKRWDMKGCIKNKEYKHYKNKANFTKKMNKLEAAVKAMLKHYKRTH